MVDYKQLYVNALGEIQAHIKEAIELEETIKYLANKVTDLEDELKNADIDYEEVKRQLEEIKEGRVDVSK